APAAVVPRPLVPWPLVARTVVARAIVASLIAVIRTIVAAIVARTVAAVTHAEFHLRLLHAAIRLHLQVRYGKRGGLRRPHGRDCGGNPHYATENEISNLHPVILTVFGGIFPGYVPVLH